MHSVRLIAAKQASKQHKFPARHVIDTPPQPPPAICGRRVRIRGKGGGGLQLVLEAGQTW